MKVSNLVAFAFAAFLLNACEFNNEKDYNPKADFQAFLKKQEKQKKRLLLVRLAVQLLP